MKPVAPWRIAAAVAVLVALIAFGAMFAPIYAGNLKLQTYVSEMTQRVGSKNQPDETLRQSVLQRARELDLPVKADNVHILRSSEGIRIDVRYFVRVTVPGYTVDLHFYPGAGSR